MRRREHRGLTVLVSAGALIAATGLGMVGCAGGRAAGPAPPTAPDAAATALAKAHFAVEAWEPGRELAPQLGANLLQPAGGLVLDAQDTREQGGFSALWVSPGCERMVAISDYTGIASRIVDPTIHKAGWFSARLSWSDQGELTGLELEATGQLAYADGDPVLRAESMAVRGDRVYLSLDDRAGILGYHGASPADALRSVPEEAVPDLPDFTVENADDGLEAITTTADGRILAIQECKPEIDDPRVRTGARCRVWSASPTGGVVTQARYATELWPSGAATLPGGDVLVLERHWIPGTGTQSIRVVRLAADLLGPAALASDPLLDGDVWLDVVSADGSLDNFEGIATCNLGGETRVMLLSDNNGDWRRALAGQNPQRSLLVAFAIRGH